MVSFCAALDIHCSCPNRRVENGSLREERERVKGGGRTGSNMVAVFCSLRFFAVVARELLKRLQAKLACSGNEHVGPRCCVVLSVGGVESK